MNRNFAIHPVINSCGKWLRKHPGICCIAGILLCVALWFFATGMLPRSDVFIDEYEVIPSEGTITIHTGVASSMGYVRSCRNVSGDPERMILRFYSAYGGFNSALAAQNVFTLKLHPECTSIWIDEGGELRQALIRRDGSWYPAYVTQ